MFYYQTNILNDFDIKLITKYLNNIDDFRCNPKCSDTSQFGRLQKWYQEDSKYFCPLWKIKHEWWESFDYDSNLLYFQNIIQNKLHGLKYDDNINSLINKYRDGNICLLTTKKDKENIIIDYKLENNSLFIMSGDSQTCYSHQLLKDDSNKERYSLTFRNFIL